MAGRTLGGGRILGSGKGLAPPSAPSTPPIPSPYTPSESSLSIASSAFSPPAQGASLSDGSHDIGASISIAAHGHSGSTASTGLLCPICSEEMMTLLQLNRHIDDAHQELPEEAQDEVKTWFDKQVLKAKKFQPLSLINQKLRGLDVFESNEVQITATPTAMGKAAIVDPVDPDELITRNHWQRATSRDFCTEPACGKSLGAMNGSVNCRKCGRLFCEDHTMYQMKLSRSASHEPVRGYWARVCETCYKSREGYNDHHGKIVDHYQTFNEIRSKRVERQKLETARLEKRLDKLTKLLANPPKSLSSSGSLLSPVATMSGHKGQRKMIEQSVVTWEDDTGVSKCPFCQQEFGSWTYRRHHCRVCGRVVCADPQTACSAEVPLKVVAEAPVAAEKVSSSSATNQLALDVRMCRECNHAIFSHRDFTTSITSKPQDQRAYEALCQFERGIVQLLPSFHRALRALQAEKSDSGEVDLNKPPPTHAQIQEAAKLRKRLIDSFGKYGLAAKRLRDLDTSSPTQKRLQMAVYTYASNFLHTNMLPLKSVPQMLRSRSAQVVASPRIVPTSHHSASSLRYSQVPASDTASQAASESSTIVSQLESEEKELRERLAILEEQRFMVVSMTRTARDARRFEEVTALTRNVEELDKEIGDLKDKISSVEAKFEGVFRDGS